MKDLFKYLVNGLLVLTLINCGSGMSTKKALNEIENSPTDIRTAGSGPLLESLGINADDPSPSKLDIEKIAKSNAGWIRMWFWWKWLEPQRGQIDWSVMDAQVNWAKKQGLKIYASIAGIPPWANGSSPSCDLWVAADCSRPFDNVDYYKEFLSKAIYRYKEDIKHWGPWNEPNLKIFWDGDIDSFIEKVFRPAHEVIRSIDPNLIIVGPDLSHDDNPNNGRSFYVPWLEKILQENLVDVISHHIYEKPKNVVEELQDEVFPIIARNGKQNLDFWLTETGFSACEGFFRDEEDQGDDLEDFFEEVEDEDVKFNGIRIPIRTWMKKFFYFNISDRATPPSCFPLYVVDPNSRSRLRLRERPSVNVLREFFPRTAFPTDYDHNTSFEVEALREKMLEKIGNDAPEGVESSEARKNWYVLNFFFNEIMGQNIVQLDLIKKQIREKLDVPINSPITWGHAFPGNTSYPSSTELTNELGYTFDEFWTLAGEFTRIRFTFKRSSEDPDAIAVVNAASLEQRALSPGGFSSLFAQDLTGGNSESYPGGTELTNELLGIKILINGIEAPLSYVGDSQINFVIPNTLAPALHKIEVIKDGVTIREGNIIVQPHSFGIFTSNQGGFGAAAGNWVGTDGSQGDLVNLEGQLNRVPISNGSHETYVSLFGTGLNGLTKKDAVVYLNNSPVEIQFLGGQSEFLGLDQLNIRIPLDNSLLGKTVELYVELPEIQSNKVEIRF